MTDNTVPEGHKGLHGYLYGDGGAEVHDGADRQYQSREVRDVPALVLLKQRPEQHAGSCVTSPPLLRVGAQKVRYCYLIR